jgi:hypothetical protein
MTDPERVAALERQIEVLAKLCDALADGVNTSHARVLALQVGLERSGSVTAAAINAKMQEIELHAEAALELSPHYEQFRELRRRVQEAGGEQP